MNAPEVNRWLLSEGRTYAAVPELLEALGSVLNEEDAVDRIWVGTKVLHPQAAAYLWIWTQEKPVFTGEISYDRFEVIDSVDNPIQRLRMGAPFIRFSRTREAHPELKEIRALWEQGYTDYYGLTLLFRGQFVGAVTWATRRAEGFSEPAIALFDAIMPTLSAILEPLARDLISATLLRTYLGNDAGNRVAAGQVRRGDRQNLRAAVWFCDVRGFTKMSTELSRPVLLDLLNDVFEVVVEGTEAEGGQVLKFLGDGVLVVFADADMPDAARNSCARATRAADAVQGRLSTLRTTRENLGLPTANVGIGLHYGDLTYGNVGAPHRLDFTVIGHSVNLAARVEALCSDLGASLLATEDFASRSTGWVREGEHTLKGVLAPVMVFKRFKTR